MELSHLSFEGDRRQDDNQEKEKKRRFNPINPVTKRAVSGWLSPSEVSSKVPPQPEQRMPVSIVAPEGSPGQSRTISHEAALRSDVWLGGEVHPPDYEDLVAPVSPERLVEDQEFDTSDKKHPERSVRNQQSAPTDRQEPPAPVNTARPSSYEPTPEVTSTTTEEDAFQQLLQRAGLDELSRSLEQTDEIPTSFSAAGTQAEVPAPATAERRQSPDAAEVARSQARTRVLISYAAGLIIGSHLEKNKVHRELTRALHEVDENMSASEAQGAADSYRHKPEVHVLQDAWHGIVVDKYGREDMTARQQYGQGFKQEQQEIRQSALSDTTPAGSSPTQAMPYDDTPLQSPSTRISAPPLPDPRQSFSQSPLPTSMPSLPAGLTQPQLQPGVSTRKDPQHLLPARAKASASLVVNPWVWLVVGLLILVFFAASLIG